MKLNQLGKLIGFAKSSQCKGISYFFHPAFNLNPMTWDIFSWFPVKCTIVENSIKCKTKSRLSFQQFIYIHKCKKKKKTPRRFKAESSNVYKQGVTSASYYSEEEEKLAITCDNLTDAFGPIRWLNKPGNWLQLHTTHLAAIRAAAAAAAYRPCSGIHILE